MSALCDLGVEKIDPAAAKPGNGSRPTSLLTDQHRSRARSSASVTPFSSSSLRLARAAHARLQFDHPSLDATAVDALSKAVLELKFVDKIDQRNIALAPTRKLVAALAGDPPSLALPAGDESGGDEAGEADEDKARARALDAAAASSGCWDRLAVSYTVKMVLSVLESLPRPSSCSSSSSTSEAKGPGSSPPPPSALSPLLLLSRLAAELDEEGERAEEEVARRAAAAAAGGGAGGEEVERALAAFLGQHDEEKEEGEGEASDAAAAAAAPEPGERTGEAESDDDSDYDTPLHQEAAAGRGAPVGDGVDPLSAVAAGEDDDDDSAPSSLLAAPPSLPSAVRAMVSLVQAARSRVGRGWGEAGGIELTAACLVAVRRAAAADSEASPPLRRLGTELLLLARDGAVASPLRGAAALPTLLDALGGASSGGSDDDGAPRAPAALADAAELFAAVVAGWPLPSPSSSSSFASSSSESRLALARAWKDSTTGAAGRTTNLLESLAAALLAATGGGSLEGAKRALAELNGDDDSSPPSSSPPPSSSSSSSSPSSSYLLGAACSALAALLMASQAAGASAEEVAGGMLGSGAWRSVACLLGAAAASPPGGDVVDDVDDENGGRTRLLPLPRGALEAALLGSASSPELSRYLAASPAGKFVVVEAAKIEGGGSGGVEGAMLSALFAAASSASEQKNSPFSSAPLARMISASYMEEREVPKGSPSVRWRESARLLREMSRVAGGGGGGGHRWGAEVDAAVASLERALISAAAASSADSEVEVEERIVPAGEEAKKSPEAAHRREALRLASAERRRAAAAAAGVAAASPPSSFYAAAAASAAAPAVTRGKDD